MTFKFLDEYPSSVVKEVDASIMERSKDPWTVLVEGETLHTLALGLKLILDHLYLLYNI
jgi:hypothetical protein